MHDAALDEFLKRRFPERPTGDRVFTCQHCDAPVVDSQPGREGHQNRLGHWPVERKRA